MGLSSHAHILIVEDDRDIAQLLGRVFLSAGYATGWASDGLRALEALAEEVPDLLTLDLYLPLMNGVDVLAQIRAMPQCRQLPIIVLTTCEVLPPQVYAQANKVMTKPFDITALLTATERLLNNVPPRAHAIGAAVFPSAQLAARPRY